MGGHVELECATQDQGDWMTVWKNGTRVISVGSLQVKMKKNVLDFRVLYNDNFLDLYLLHFKFVVFCKS